jgi:metallo-beta-lactamase family protein
LAKKKEKEIKISFVDEPAAEDVTGSGVLVTTPNHNILLDYGLAQSNNKYTDFMLNNRKTKGFKAKNIDIVFISHLHADHSLLCPKLYKDGFRGATIVSAGSKSTFRTMAEDSAYISERDILVINNQHDKNYEPLYNIEHVNLMLEHTLEKPMNEIIKVDDELSFELIPSGHLLGGCQIILYITIDNVTKSILYTGDIGNREIHNYFVGEYQPVTKFIDLAICESTYGNRPELKTGIKERKNDITKLKSIIDMQIKEMKGRVVIPTFAQSRCQQLALMVYELYKDEEWQPRVYIDSPLSIAIFQEYKEILEGEEKEKFDELLNWENLIFVKESDDSKALIQSKEPCLVLSSAGMCNVGRIRHHLKSVIPDPNATILFVGFSTEGSLASMLKDNKRRSIIIDEKEYKCRCASYSLKSMSGHMPFGQMLQTYSDLHCNKIVLHHGSTDAKEILAKKLKEELEKKCKSTRVVIANSGLKFNL